MGITIYRASAGSGKTYALTRAWLRRVLAQEHPLAYTRQLALTFTKKATEEMKFRILKLIDQLSLPEGDLAGEALRKEFCEALDWKGADAQEKLRQRAITLRANILHDYGRFSVLTIDSFFQRIVRSFIWEAGLPPGYSVDLDSQRLLQEAIEQVVEEVSEHPQNRAWIASILAERIHEGKRWDVQEAFSEVGRQVFSEKFRAFGKEYIDKLGDKEFLKGFIKELRTGCTAFERKIKAYATEAARLLASGGLQPEDFKGKSRSFMCSFAKIEKGTYAPSDALRKAQNNMEQWMGKKDPNEMRIRGMYDALNQFIGQYIDYYDKEIRSYNTAKMALQQLPQMGLAADIARHLNVLLSESSAVHLSQTLLLLHALTSKNDAPFILERMGSQYSDFLLDEFQDTSVLQWEVLLPLIQNGLAQGGESLVVGDVKQSIYRWRNSDWRILGYGIREDIAPFVPEEKYLLINWRSRELIIQTMNDLFERLTQAVQAEFHNKIPENLPLQEQKQLENKILEAYADVRQQIAPDKKDTGGHVLVYNIEATEEKNAAEQVAERLPRIIMDVQDRGFNSSDIAILVRTKQHGQQVASALMSFKQRPEAAGYCFDVASPDTLFLDESPEVQLIMAIFRQLVYPQERINNRLIEHLMEQLEVQANVGEELRQQLRSLSLAESFELLLQTLAWTHRSNCIPFIQELHNQILNYSRNQASDLFSFLQWWDSKGDKITLNLERSEAAIEILTIHKAKGLQYPVVIIPFCDWAFDYSPGQAPVLWVEPKQAPFTELRYLPQKYSAGMLQSDFAFDYLYEKQQYYIDQLNVFYVAATRAEDELHILLPQPAKKRFSLAPALKELIFANTEEDTGLQTRSYGAALSVTRAQTLPQAGMLHYPSVLPKLKIHTQLADDPLRSGASDNALTDLSPRRRGLLLHKAFSRIYTHQDVDRVLQELQNEGEISSDPQEIQELLQFIRTALAQPQAVSWFDGSWKLYNEAAILLPANASLFSEQQHVRPDRVMEKEGKVVLVDYKFGVPRPAHQKQIDSYVQVLKQMGYSQVEGYVWYVQDNSIPNSKLNAYPLY